MIRILSKINALSMKENLKKKLILNFILKIIRKKWNYSIKVFKTLKKIVMPNEKIVFFLE
jgi:hypothetical protein